MTIDAKGGTTVQKSKSEEASDAQELSFSTVSFKTIKVLGSVHEIDVNHFYPCLTI